MSLPPPPPPGGGGGGAGGGGAAAGNPVIKRSSHADYGGPSRTLKQLSKVLSDPERRWEAVKMLRLVRMRLDGWDPTEAEMRGLYEQLASVARVGRLSEIGVQLPLNIIKANPNHLDVDWFGEVSHWWNQQIRGSTIEENIAEALLEYLEDSLGLIPAGSTGSGIKPGTWNWPAGQPTANRTWMDLFDDPFDRWTWTTKFDDLIFEWHMPALQEITVRRRGPNDEPFQLHSSTSKGERFQIRTPSTSRPADIPPPNPQ